jgi:hypothetical protein
VSEPLKIWRYDGQWSQVPDPTAWADGEDRDVAMDRGGFARADGWGQARCGQVEIYEHRDAERWLVTWSVDINGRGHTIEVCGLPNLLDLLPKLAAIATASLLTQVLKNHSLAALAHTAAEAEEGRKRKA